MESAFSSNFAGVRVHTGPAAHDAALALGARALTAGTNILFRAGEYQPGTPGGDRLLAHELAHVVQQAHGLPQAILDTGATDHLERAAGLAADHASPAAEREAHGAAMIAAMGGPVPVLSRQPPTVARQDDLDAGIPDARGQRQPSGAKKSALPDWGPRRPASTSPPVSVKDPKVRSWSLRVNGKPQSVESGWVGVHSGDRATVRAEISLNGSRPRSLLADGAVLENQALRTDADDELDKAVYGRRPMDPGSISQTRWVADNVVEWDVVFGGRGREGAKIDVSTSLADARWSESNTFYFRVVDPDVNVAEIDQKKTLFIEARKNLPDKIRNRATLWLTAASLGLQNAHDPEDPTQAANFYRALGGNLLWAATSLFAEWSPIVIAMSFVGGMAASGVGAEKPSPSGKGELAGLLTKARDKLVETTDEISLELATRFAQDLISEPAAQEQALWDTLFPGIEYESSDGIRMNVEAELNRRLVSFRQQYEAWKNRTEKEGVEEADIDPNLGSVVDVEMLRQRSVDIVRERNPFQANFDALGVSVAPKEKKDAPRRWTQRR